MITKLHAILRDISERRSRQRLHLGFIAVWWIGLLLLVVLWTLGVTRSVTLWSVLPVLAAASIATVIWSKSALKDPRRTAKDIEAEHPELQTALLAALDQKIDPAIGEPTYLQNRVVRETLLSSQRGQWLDRIPQARIRDFQMLQLVSLALLAITLIIFCVPRKTTAGITEKIATTNPAAAPPFSVDPGDVEIERGSPLTILARFPKALPDSVTLEVTAISGAIEKIPLTRPFSDPIFQTRLPAVNDPLTYKVTIPGAESSVYHVKVFEIPALRKMDAILHLPGFLAKPPQNLTDIHTVHAPEGSRLELSLFANLPGLSASLVAKDQKPISLTPAAGEPARYTASLDLTESIRYEIILKDSANRRNSAKDFLEIKVTKNKAPVIEVVLPRKNEKATAIQEVVLEARIRDDTEVLAHGLRYTLDGKQWYEVNGVAKPEEKVPLLFHRVDLEAIHAKPKDVIMWNAWAEDRDAAGKTRRVNGDIHLVQVREFDEEFYQQAAPPSTGKPNPVSGLIKTQTDILNATWGIRRDHGEISATPPKRDELETLEKSQNIAIDMSRALEAELPAPDLRQFVADARLSMQDAIDQMKLATTQLNVQPLDEAISHEQEALRLLFQLASSKTIVMMSSGESPGSEALKNESLDLKPMETPYQAEKAAKPETGEEAREAMEVLQRLGDLAKRQRDLNDEIQALQMALKDAKTPEQQAEIERRLKQLREQQRELLADMDRLKEKTADPEKKTASKEQNKALDQAREKASEANKQLEETKLGEALAAGRRSQDSLEKLEDDFREASAAKLAEQLRDLRQQARTLDEKQKELTQKSEPKAAGEAPRLNEAAKATLAIQQQRQDLEKLVEDLRQTAETAEHSEPLVANDLSEALRQADQAGISKALEAMEKAGNPAAEKAAAAGIAKLNKEVAKAAERILGNEAQTLKYAREELDRLSAEAGGKPDASKAAGDKAGEGEKPGEKGKDGQPGGKGEAAANGKGEDEGGGKTPGGKGEPGGEGKGKAPGEGSQPGETAGQGKGKGEGQGEGQGQGDRPGKGKGQGSGNGEGQGGGSNGTGSRNSAIVNEQFRGWSDRLHDLEAVIDDPRARSEVAKARKASTELRKDFKRHSKDPAGAIQSEVLAPLAEARHALDERLRELNKENPLAAIGSDPVPDRYSEIVRRYFEELGK
jgi:hypothetical protein